MTVEDKTTSGVSGDTPSPVPCANNTILIVDDDASVRLCHQTVLGHYFPDCSLDSASDGLKAVDLFAEGHHKIVLTDLHMPVMNGERAFERIMEVCSDRKWRKPCVLFCTGHAPSPAIRATVGNNPAHGLLIKPVANRTLIQAVKQRLNGLTPDNG
ncbi:MAG: response regulator [Kiritimatiellia bacterium]